MKLWIALILRFLRADFLWAFFMYKESKEATGFGLVDDLVNDVGIRDSIERQWFILISSKPILFDEVDPEDEEIIDAGKLPFEIEPDVLYTYDESCNDTPPIETIPLKDVADITVKKKTHSEQFYRFVLNLGQKKIHVITHNVLDMMKWVKALQASRATVKEQSKSKLPSVKNIYWHRKILDEQGEEALMEKIYMESENLAKKLDVMKFNDITGLIKMQRVTAEELIAVINACLVHKERRLDIVKLYMSCFHENIIASFRSFFKKNEKSIDNKDCFEMINFFIWYRDMLHMFGDAFTDKRILEGITMLCKIVSRRILKSNLQSTQNIVNQILEAKPAVDGKGRLSTNGPNDLFRIVYESFGILTHCNHKELASGLLESCRYTLTNYQEGLHYLIGYCELDPTQLSALCNDTMLYVSNVKDFLDHIENTTPLDEDAIREHFDEGKINKGFADVSKEAYETIADVHFGCLNQEWQNKLFLEIDLKKSLTLSLDDVQKMNEKVHSNYIGKIDLACLEKIVTFYITAFLQTAEKKKFKKEDFTKISEKLEDDRYYLRDLFGRSLKPYAIENVTTPMTSFHDFLNTNYAFLSTAVKSMKEIYGSAIKWATFELLIMIRNDELDQEEKDELFKSCEEAYENTQRNPEMSKSFNVFRHVDQDFVIEGNHSVGTTEDLIVTIVEDSDTSLSQSSRDSFSVNRSFALQNLEGYLEAEKDEFLSDMGSLLLLSNLKFERRYFAIRRDILYYYKSKSSESAMGSYTLKEVLECTPDDNDSNTFYIKFQLKNGEKKQLSFKADSIDKRDQWVAAINDARTLEDRDALVEVQATDIKLFRDTKPVFTEIENMPEVKFEPEDALIYKETPGDPKRKKSMRRSRRSKVSIDDSKNAKKGCFKRLCEALCCCLCCFGCCWKKKKSADGDYTAMNDVLG